MRFDEISENILKLNRSSTKAQRFAVEGNAFCTVYDKNMTSKKINMMRTGADQVLERVFGQRPTHKTACIVDFKTIRVLDPLAAIYHAGDKSHACGEAARMALPTLSKTYEKMKAAYLERLAAQVAAEKKRKPTMLRLQDYKTHEQKRPVAKAAKPAARKPPAPPVPCKKVTIAMARVDSRPSQDSRQRDGAKPILLRGKAGDSSPSMMGGRYRQSVTKQPSVDP